MEENTARQEISKKKRWQGLEGSLPWRSDIWAECERGNGIDFKKGSLLAEEAGHDQTGARDREWKTAEASWRRATQVWGPVTSRSPDVALKSCSCSSFAQIALPFLPTLLNFPFSSPLPICPQPLHAQSSVLLSKMPSSKQSLPNPQAPVFNFFPLHSWLKYCWVTAGFRANPSVNSPSFPDVLNYTIEPL